MSASTSALLRVGSSKFSGGAVLREMTAEGPVRISSVAVSNSATSHGLEVALRLFIGNVHDSADVRRRIIGIVTRLRQMCSRIVLEPFQVFEPSELEHDHTSSSRTATTHGNTHEMRS